MLFLDRVDAGQRLSSRLREFADRGDVVVLALPRGGVPVAFEVAKALRLRLDVLVVRKIGVPGQDIVRMANVSPEQIEEAVNRESTELERRERSYRGSRNAVDVAGRTVILVDDGLATGSSMRAAIAALREKGVAMIVSAIPVAASSTCKSIRAEVDTFICLFAPINFSSVGEFYRDFSETSDQDVHDLLSRSSEWSVRSAD